MLDSDLAKLYGVETKRIIEAVRNKSQSTQKDFLGYCLIMSGIFLRSKISTSSLNYNNHVCQR